MDRHYWLIKKTLNAVTQSEEKWMDVRNLLQGDFMRWVFVYIEFSMNEHKKEGNFDTNSCRGAENQNLVSRLSPRSEQFIS